MSEDRNGKSELVQLGALWRNEGKDGKDDYLSGSFGAAQVFVFKNKFKKKDNEPDFRIMVGARKRKEENTEAAPEKKSSGDVPF